LIASGVTIGLAICFYVLIYRPSAEEIDSLYTGMHDYKQLENREKVVLANQSRSRSEMEEFTTQVACLRDRLLPAEEEDSFMQSLRKLVMDADVFDESVKRKGMQQRGVRDFLAFQVQMKGQFENIYTFLRAVESMEKNVWLDKIQLSKVENRDGFIALDLSMSVPMSYGEE